MNSLPCFRVPDYNLLVGASGNKTLYSRLSVILKRTSQARDERLTYFPDILVQMTVLIKSECPLYRTPGVLLSLFQLQISLSQHPAKIVLPPGPPTAIDVMGAIGPRYTVFVSLVYINDLQRLFLSEENHQRTYFNIDSSDTSSTLSHIKITA